jgi:hypothetical protein
MQDAMIQVACSRGEVALYLSDGDSTACRAKILGSHFRRLVGSMKCGSEILPRKIGRGGLIINLADICLLATVLPTRKSSD